MKAVVAAFNQEKALVGAFSVITNLRLRSWDASIVQHLTTRLQTVGGHIIGVSCKGTVQLLHCTYTPYIWGPCKTLFHAQCVSFSSLNPYFTPPFHVACVACHVILVQPPKFVLVLVL